MPDNPIKENSYRQLPDAFYAETALDPAPSPNILLLNHGLLKDIGQDTAWFESPEALAILSGQKANAACPSVSLAYSGHQFGGWSPLLGDGRAHLLGQMRDGAGDLIDVQTKGSGRTRFSRGGDGKATLASALREYLVSEAMAGLGIPTTRTLAVIATGEHIWRETPQKAGIVVRTAKSHIRVGTFQYAATALGPDNVKALADHVIQIHFPEASDSANPYRSLLDAVIARQAGLIARWMLVGFIHGVMNTDNMSIVGETIDFGPCAFMDEFRPDKVFSSIDTGGRYAWNRQATMAQWNLARFAETLLPLLAEEEQAAVAAAQEALSGFVPVFDSTFWSGFAHKLGLNPGEDSRNLAQQTLALLSEEQTDFTVFFDQLTSVAAGEDQAGVTDLFLNRDITRPWLERWQALRATDACGAEEMRRANPRVIARNHQVEAALADASERGDLTLAKRLAAALRHPFEVSDADRDLMVPPEPSERITQTFCGT